MWGLVFWREIPDAQTAIGIVLIVGSGIYNFLRVRRETGPVDTGFGVGSRGLN